MEKIKLIATVLVLGSIWGVTECVIGDALQDIPLPTGAILTGIFALGLMSFSRMRFNTPGMQIGMGLVAGTLRLANPIGGSFICSAIAIMAEGLLFELIWTRLSLDTTQVKPLTMRLSVGIITAYLLYIGGFTITQILTPFFSSAGFYAESLLAVFPQILAGGLVAALLGAATLPAIYYLTQLKLSIPERYYLPTTMSIAIICWLIVIANTFLLIS
jgi:hypothetical protein